MTERLTAKQYREMTQETTKKNKFGAKKTSVDGITFDSKRESQIYQELLLLERSRTISGLVRQRVFNLIVNSEIIGRYTADFAFIDNRQDGKLRVVDVKGVVTRDFRRVRKIIKACYNVEVEVWK